uniref:Uncharacterized protein n=1 Tax=Oryza rufipogon TaxID=4529 RepID=A0A0E0RD02_ORYRU
MLAVHGGGTTGCGEEDQHSDAVGRGKEDQGGGAAGRGQFRCLSHATSNPHPRLHTLDILPPSPAASGPRRPNGSPPAFASAEFPGSIPDSAQMPPRRRRRRSVAGIDQDDLLDPDALADPDSSFYEINGVRVHHKVCTHEDSSDQSPDSGITNADQNQIGLPIVLLHGFGSSVIKAPELPSRRQLRFDSDDYPVKRLSFEFDEAEEDDQFLEQICKMFIDLIISNQALETTGKDLIGSNSPGSCEPLLIGIADTCPDAPLRRPLKAVQLSPSICRKLDFDSVSPSGAVKIVIDNVKCCLLDATAEFSVSVGTWQLKAVGMLLRKPIPSPMTMLPAYPPSLPPRVASRLSPPRNHQSRVDLLRVPLLRAPATNDGALYCGNLLLSRCIAAAWLRSLEVTYYLTSIAAAWLRSLSITYYPARSVLHAATAAVSTPSMHAVVRFAWMSDLSLMGGVVRTGVVAFKHWALAMPSLLLVVAAQGMVLYMASNFLLLLAWPLSMMNLPAACGTAIGEDKPIEAISITGILCASPRQCTVRGNSKGLILPINSNH